jgi:hypothetical protein
MLPIQEQIPLSDALAKNAFHHHTFLAMIETRCDNDEQLDLRALVENFPLDVQINKSKTKIVQKTGLGSGSGSGSGTAAGNTVVLDRSLPICSTRSKNKQISSEYRGFVKLSLPQSQDIMLYTNPPDIIPMDCFCNYCGNRGLQSGPDCDNKFGPHAHDILCMNPKKTNLHITLDAYMYTIYSGIYKVKGPLSQCSEEFTEKLREYIEEQQDLMQDQKQDKKQESKSTIQLARDFVNELKKAKDDLYENLFFDNSEHYNMRISLSSILILKKQDKDGMFFVGPIMLRYKIDSGSNSKSVTIRIRKNGFIELISNPWTRRHLYKEVIERINMAGHNVTFLNGSIKTFFSSVNLFRDASKYMLDLNKVYDYLWLNNTYPKYRFNDNFFYIFSENTNVVYKYQITMDKSVSKRMYASFQKYMIYENEYIPDKYKISVQLFAQGHLQTTFGYIPNEPDINYTVDEQFNIIQSLFVEIQNLFLYYLSMLIRNDPDVLILKEKKKISKKIYETLPGIMPYAKRKRFKVADEVQVFNYAEKAYSKKTWKVIEVRPISNEDSSIVCPENQYLYICEDKRGTRKELTHNDIRKIDPNNDQVCRLNEVGIPRQPYPYSFFGQCPGGLDQWISPLGIISRSDNYFYPTCSQVTPEVVPWVINFLLNGYSKTELRYGHFNRMSKNIDTYCGTFKPCAAEIGAVVSAKIDGEYTNVQIIDKYKTHGLGNDNNLVKYKVIPIDSDTTGYVAGGECTVGLGDFKSGLGDFKTDSECLDENSADDLPEITGYDFHKSHVESRFYKGLLKMTENEDHAKRILMECARRLHLITSPEKNKKPAFKETLLSKYNISNICEPNIIKHCTIIPEYEEDCYTQTLYVSDEHAFSFESCENMKYKVHGYVRPSRKLGQKYVFYPVCIYDETGALESLDNFEYDEFEISTITYDIVLNWTQKNYMQFISDNILEMSARDSSQSSAKNSSQSYEKNVPLIIHFVCGTTIYKWSTLNRNSVNLKVTEVQKRNGRCPEVTLSADLSEFDFVDKDNEPIPIRINAKVSDMVSFRPNMLLYDFQRVTVNPVGPIVGLRVSATKHETNRDAIGNIICPINIKCFERDAWRIHPDYYICEKPLNDGTGRTSLSIKNK